MTLDSFVELNLDAKIMQALDLSGYSKPTQVQAQSFTPAFLRKDIRVMAQTGTGKTAAYILPILQRLLPQANESMSPARHPVRVLVVTPTRELAVQVHRSVVELTQFTSMRSAVVYGGVNSKNQETILKQGVEWLVVTPGRMLDHLQQNNINLSAVEVVVLDEADRMLDMGFMPDVKRIIASLPTGAQKLLFSATYSPEMRTIANGLLTDPVVVEIEMQQVVSKTISHQALHVPLHDKWSVLKQLLNYLAQDQILIFTRTKRQTRELAQAISRLRIRCDALHSDRSQAEREAVLVAFKSNKIRVLVATDIAARGLDVEELPCVINYELPNVAEDYVHRIGRTGRAGRSGKAISLVAPNEEPLVKAIEVVIGQKVVIASCEDYQTEPSQALPAQRTREKKFDDVRSTTEQRQAPTATRSQNAWPNKNYEPASTLPEIIPVLLGGTGR